MSKYTIWPRPTDALLDNGLIGLMNYNSHDEATEVLNDLADLDFVRTFRKASGLVTTLKILYNLFNGFIVFVDGNESTISADSSYDKNPVATALRNIITPFAVKDKAIVITFNNVIDTTKEIEIMAKLL